ncbi:hypothetical protein NIES970_00740 [[Synechococcus] sp. NIES-970]|uniref:tetratricopeptide repeat protein n=1 Tax=Picosynechococcus sp. NKBG15041c TaxID=1407650 RepID=UPI000410FE4B|nr:hypothetical protein [Picosynechococcus sp. NKBG15041c]BAW95174.1 hypothetical protein NIES970_00740 [[Synechococcus] sp. NIES-970]
MKFIDSHRLIPLASLAMGCSLAMMPPVSAQPEAIQDNISDLRPLQGSSILSMAGASRVMDEAIAAISAQDYDVAVTKLQEARQVYNQLSNFHLDLANSFQGLDNTVHNAERRAAIAAGEMRDTATYRLALVHRAQEKPELAVPLLIQVIRSQTPTSDLGERAYQQLLEIGFVTNEFTRPQF